MKTTAFALALAFGMALSMAAYAQTPATPAKPAQTNAATPAKPAQAQAKLDCTKTENKAKDECKAAVKKP